MEPWFLGTFWAEPGNSTFNERRYDKKSVSTTGLEPIAVVDEGIIHVRPTYCSVPSCSALFIQGIAPRILFFSSKTPIRCCSKIAPSSFLLHNSINASAVLHYKCFSRPQHKFELGWYISTRRFLPTQNYSDLDQFVNKQVFS